MTHLLYDVRDLVATITLNRPRQRNAFTLEMVDSWAERLLTGDMVDAERAERLGMVNSVHDDAVLPAAVADLASQPAAGPRSPWR